MAVAVLPVQAMNGNKETARIDLWEAGEGGPLHRQACAVVGALLNVNRTINWLRINPGSGAEGGGILEHLHRARKSTLRTLDVSSIGLGDRGATRFFQTLKAGSCTYLTSLHLGDNKLTDLSVGPLVVEVLRSETCNISTLDLRNNQIGGPVITQAIKFNRSLTSLDITGNPIEDDGLWQLGMLLLEDDCQCKLRSISTYARGLGRYGEHVAGEPAARHGRGAALFGVLKFNTSITDLNLSGASIAVGGARSAIALRPTRRSRTSASPTTRCPT